MCKLGLKKRQFKNSAIFKVSFKKALVNLKLAPNSKVRFTKFKNSAKFKVRLAHYSKS